MLHSGRDERRSLPPQLGEHKPDQRPAIAIDNGGTLVYSLVRWVCRPRRM
jgi:hypothetical protein